MPYHSDGYFWNISSLVESVKLKKKEIYGRRGSPARDVYNFTPRTDISSTDRSSADISSADRWSTDISFTDIHIQIGHLDHNLPLWDATVGRSWTWIVHVQPREYFWRRSHRICDAHSASWATVHHTDQECICAERSRWSVDELSAHDLS